MSANEDERAEREAYLRGAKDALEALYEAGIVQRREMAILRPLIERGDWPLKEAPCQNP